ncbi:MAG: type II secretion system protein [Proteobacteria bacterium]|nr:type II secretion system protein [Pseudomonadota bacterium]
MKTKHIKNGFTLIEIMVSMAILGIAITVIIELFSGGLCLARKSGEYSRAVFYGQQLLEELCLKKEFSTMRDEGKFEGDYYWKYAIEPVSLGAENNESDVPVEIFRIKVSVFWPGGDKNKTLPFEVLKMLVKTEDTQ